MGARILLNGVRGRHRVRACGQAGALGVLAWLAACASAGSVQEAPPNPGPDLTNPPRCEALVAERRADPEGPVDTRARPRISVMVPLRTRGPASVLMVVTEEGQVLEGSVHVTGGHPRDVVRSITEAAEQWTFVPARVDGCWVSSLFGYRIVGSSRGTEPVLNPPAPP